MIGMVFSAVDAPWRERFIENRYVQRKIRSQLVFINFDRSSCEDEIRIGIVQGSSLDSAAAMHTGSSMRLSLVILWYLLLVFVCVACLLVLVGVVLYLLISIKGIRLQQRQSNFMDSISHELKSPRVRKYMLQHEPGNPMSRPLVDNFAPHFFHHVAEMHARRTGRLARPAIEASEHVLHKRIRDLRAAFVVRAHQIDASARRIHLAAEYAVRRTRGQTQTAVNAVEIQRWFSFFLRQHGVRRSIDLRDRTLLSFSSSARIRYPSTQTFRSCGAPRAVLSRSRPGIFHEFA